MSSSSSSSSNVPRLMLARNVPDVTLCLRDSTGRPILQYPPEGYMTTCATMAVNVCRAMLKTTRFRHIFEELASKYCSLQPQVWSSAKSVGFLAADFLASIKEEDFPRIFVDDRITSPLVQGYHKGRIWDAKFRPSDQSIYLNGKMFRDMCNAWANSRKSHGRASADTRDHQNWCFLFANILLHEIIRVFITYLSKGQDAMQPGLIPSLPAIVPLYEGISGQSREDLVFGGNSFVWGHRKVGDYESSKLIYSWFKNGERLSESETIEKTLKEKIEFPYPTNDIKYRWDRLKMHGGGSASEFPDPVDYSDWPEVRYVGDPTT